MEERITKQTMIKLPWPSEASSFFNSLHKINQDGKTYGLLEKPEYIRGYLYAANAVRLGDEIDERYVPFYTILFDMEDTEDLDESLEDIQLTGIYDIINGQ